MAGKRYELNHIAARVMTKPDSQSRVKAKPNRLDRRIYHPPFRLIAWMMYLARTKAKVTSLTYMVAKLNK